MPATFTLKGKVTDAALGTAVPDATVKIVGGEGTNFGKTAVTDKQGKYVITGLNPGRILVEASLAYSPQEKDNTVAGNSTLNFQLTKA